MHGGSDEPRNGIADVQRKDVVGEARADGGDPDDTEQAGADQRHDHGQDSLAHAAHDAAPDVHQSAEEIGRAHDQQAVHARLHHGVLVLAGGKNQQQFFPEHPQHNAQRNADEGHKPHAQEGNLLDARILSRADVLPDKGQGCRIDRVHGDVQEAVQVASRRVARHDVGAVGVYGGLDDDIGQREQRPLQSGGKPDQHHFLQALPVQREPGYAAAAFLPEHEDQDCGGGYVLRGGRGDADAQRAQPEACDHQDIQPDVGNAGNCQEEQRVLRVAARSLNGGKVIVQQAARHSGEVRLHVRNGAWQDFLCCTHQPEQWLGCEEAEHADRHAPDERHGQGGIRLCKNVQRGSVSGRATGRDRAVRCVADCGAFGQSCGQRQRKRQRPGVQSAPDRENRLGAGRLRSRLGSGPGRRIGRCRIVRRGALRVRRSIRTGTGRAGGAVAGGSPASGQHEASARQQQCEQEG